MARKATDFLYGVCFARAPVAVLTRVPPVVAGPFYMVLRVCSFFGHRRSQLIVYLSDDFDCGEWLLFEVRTQYGQPI